MTPSVPFPELVDDRTAAEWCRAADRKAAQQGNDKAMTKASKVRA